MYTYMYLYLYMYMHTYQCLALLHLKLVCMLYSEVHLFEVQCFDEAVFCLEFVLCFL